MILINLNKRTSDAKYKKQSDKSDFWDFVDGFDLVFFQKLLGANRACAYHRGTYRVLSGMLFYG